LLDCFVCELFFACTYRAAPVQCALMHAWRMIWYLSASRKYLIIPEFTLNETIYVHTNTSEIWFNACYQKLTNIQCEENIYNEFQFVISTLL